MLFPSQTEGYNQLLMKMWKKIKRELGLELLSCDRFRHQDELIWEDNAVNYLEHIARMPEKPEVLIHYGGYAAERIERYKEVMPDYPANMRIVRVSSGNTDKQFEPEHVVFASAQNSDLLRSAFTLLLERMRSPEAPPVHRLIPYEIKYLQSI